MAQSNVVPFPYSGGSSEHYAAPGGGTRVPGSFGAGQTTFGMDAAFMGPGYNANHYFAGPRAQELEFRGRFYHGTQHDWRPYDQDGRMLGPKEIGGFAGQMQFLNSADNPSYVPMSVRRPHAPYRLARIIVKEFTGLLFGQGRWPKIVSDDPMSQVFAEEVEKAANLWNRFHRARDLGGSRGVSMISWYFAAGKPRARVHNGRFCTVLSWYDADELIPAHVTELYQSEATRHTKNGAETYFVWVRRDWTMEADLVFKPIEVTGENPVQWTVDEERSIHHGDGECHVAWLTNFADDEDPACTDGVPDYDTLYDLLNTLDELNSLVVRGIAKNIDPTLVLRVERELVKRGMVMKGSDHALAVGESGNAEYLSIPADVVTAGKTLIDMLRQQGLEAAQCVVPDPDKVAAAGISSVAMKMMYALALNAADLLREPYGKGLLRIVEQMQRSSARRMGTAGAAPEVVDTVEVTVDAPAANDATADEQQGITLEHEELPPEEQEREERAVEYFFDLPDRVVTEPEVDESGNPTGKTVQRLVPVAPGKGSFTLKWPDYFPATAQDKQAQAGALSTAAGGKPVLSQRTATEEAARLYGVDPVQETERMAVERKIAHDEEQGLFPAIGGNVPADGQLPPGATLPAGDGETEGLITPSAMEVIVTVNEARAKAPDPLGPLLLLDGTPDPDGNLTVSAYRAKMEALLAAVGENIGNPQPDPAPEPESPAPLPPAPEPEDPAFPVE